jgi:hypothetical protein
VGAEIVAVNDYPGIQETVFQGEYFKLFYKKSGPCNCDYEFKEFNSGMVCALRSTEYQNAKVTVLWLGVFKPDLHKGPQIYMKSTNTYIQIYT